MAKSKTPKNDKMTAKFNKKNTLGGKGKVLSKKYVKSIKARVESTPARRETMGRVSRATAGTKNTGARGLVGRSSALGQSLRKAIAKDSAKGRAEAAKIRARMSSSLVKGGLAAVRPKGTLSSNGRKTKSDQTILNRAGKVDRDSGLDRSK